MNDFERLKAIIFELYALGDDQSVETDVYVDVCLQRIEEAHEILLKMLPPSGTA